jgi:aminopeptidase-like protein
MILLFFYCIILNLKFYNTLMDTLKLFKKKNKMMKWAEDLFPLCRSLTGRGNIKTFKYIKNKINNNFKIFYVNSNKKVFDWKIPLQWEIKDAFITLPNGKKICKFKDNNLHIMGYSKPIKKEISYLELKDKIYTIKNKPTAIPYVTSYYKKDWGFCMPYNSLKKLPKKGIYKVFIDSKIFKGKMGSMELVIPGVSKKEILIVSYICHPSMANNELSGPLVIMALAKILKKSFYSIRLLLIPETIGAINYINKKKLHLKKNLVAGFNITCVGSNGPMSFIQSKDENTYADKIANRILKNNKDKKINFLKRGSNERQFGCQNLRLPFVTITKNALGNYNEYHTSLDNLNYIKEKNLLMSLKTVINIISEIQNNRIYLKKQFCELFLTKHKLMGPLSFVHKSKPLKLQNIQNFLAFCDYNNDTTQLKKILNTNNITLKNIIKILKKKKLIKQFS